MVNQTDTIPERWVVTVWQNRLSGRTDLITEEGEPLRIVYPGRVNDDRGPDLLDAVIITSRGLLRGDIEVHVKSSSWRAHRHHLDPSYNRVILHVVLWHDTETDINLENGQKVPTLALHRFVNTADRYVNAANIPNGCLPCRNAKSHWTTGAIGGLLEIAGKKRYLAKAARFRDALARTGEAQSFYEGIMWALGYTKNKYALGELARRVPLQCLESVTSGKASDVEYLARQQALLIGMAGLLPSQRSERNGPVDRRDEWVEKLEEVWASSHRKYPMSEDDWHLFKVRPSNFPTRRIAAMSYLLLRYKEKGIFRELVRKLGEAPVDTGHNVLEKALRVAADGYWANHLDLGLPTTMIVPSLLGEGRAADIIVNVLLPFAAAWGRLTRQPELVVKAFDLYRHHPRLAVNTVERHMREQIGISRYLVSSAQRQQGLLHIYQTLCTQGKCLDCPMGGAAD